MWWRAAALDSWSWCRCHSSSATQDSLVAADVQKSPALSIASRKARCSRTPPGLASLSQEPKPAPPSSSPLLLCPFLFSWQRLAGLGGGDAAIIVPQSSLVGCLHSIQNSSATRWILGRQAHDPFTSDSLPLQELAASKSVAACQSPILLHDEKRVSSTWRGSVM